LANIGTVSRNIPKEIAELELKDLTFITTLGVGGFGRVELVYGKNFITRMNTLYREHVRLPTAPYI
jgi:hypothetical protein